MPSKDELLGKVAKVAEVISDADPKEVDRVVKIATPIVVGVGGTAYTTYAVRKLTPLRPSYRDTRRALAVLGWVAYTVGANFAIGQLIAQEAREAARS